MSLNETKWNTVCESVNLCILAYVRMFPSLYLLVLSDRYVILTLE